ncbi:hypothetical protein M3Y99_01037500 [Aphelenchoides fujianensis]|nr:hypothetical protein M3Y99_01037500 [Aphelenchoides fujianensis]
MFGFNNQSAASSSVFGGASATIGSARTTGQSAGTAATPTPAVSQAAVTRTVSNFAQPNVPQSFQPPAATAAPSLQPLSDEEQRQKARELDVMLNQMTSNLELRAAVVGQHADTLNWYDRYFLDSQTQLEMFNNELNTLEAEAQCFADDVKLLTDMNVGLEDTLAELNDKILFYTTHAGRTDQTLDNEETGGEKRKGNVSVESQRKQTLELTTDVNADCDRVGAQLRDANEMLANLQQTEERIQEADYDEPVLSQIKEILKLQCTNLQRVESETDDLIERINAVVAKLSVDPKP